MTGGTFWSSMNESRGVLRDLGLLKDTNIHQNRPYTKGCLEVSKSNDYLKIFQYLSDERDYDLLLKDDSMLQMNLVDGQIRLLFIQQPLKSIEAEDYIYEFHSEDMHIEGVTVDDLLDIYREEYETYLETLPLNKGAVYMRYDEDQKDYMPMIHSYTHLHIGLNNSIRIPFRCEVTPLAFVLFVLQQVYYDKWAKEFRKDDQSDNIILPYIKFKDYCKVHENGHWSITEDSLFFIS